MAPAMQKRGCSSGGNSSRPGRLALLTALSVAGTLLYVFVLLVPAWRTVSIDRALIGAFLANHSHGDTDSAARLWDALARDPLLRSRSANAFRECLSTDGPDDGGGNATAAAGSHRRDVERKSPSLMMEHHLLEMLAGVVNVTLPTIKTTTAAETEHRRSREQRGSAVSDHCWFLNLHWSEDDHQNLTSAHRSLLHCTRAMFLLAIALLLCHCVGLTGALYACFASRMAQPCRLVLFTVHCLSLSQLVALAILQDASARLSGARLLDLLAAAGFPDGCAAAVDARRGVCSLVLLCILCLVSAVNMLLLLLPMSQEADKRRHHSDNPIVSSAAASACDREDGEKMRECDDAEDTNPLI